MAWAGAAGAADYPTKLLTYNICFNPGGESDITARFQEQPLKKHFGQDIVINYKIGGGGALCWADLVGLVTPAGNDVMSTWSALLAARSGVAPIASFDASGFPVRIAAEVKNLANVAVEAAIRDRRLLKLANRSHRFALVAAAQASADAGIRPTPEAATRWGCVVGTGMMGITYKELAEVQQDAAPNGELERDRLLTARGAAAAPLTFCRSQSTAGAALLTRVFGIRGYSSSVHTACASGGQAVGTALKLIRRGVADRVLAGGFDSMINPVGLAASCLLNAVSPDIDTRLVG